METDVTQLVHRKLDGPVLGNQVYVLQIAETEW